MTRPHTCPEGLVIGAALAKALMAFAIKGDPTRLFLSGLGLDDEGCLAASDGKALARIVPGLSARDMYARRWWPAPVVQREIKIAAATKAATVTLLWSDCGDGAYGFPPASQVIPVPGIGSNSPIACDPLYLGLLHALAKALCGRHDVAVSLVTASGALDPLRFDIAGRDGMPDAQVVIMPFRVR